MSKPITGAWLKGLERPHRPWIDSLADSDQKTLKVGIHIFPA